MSKLEELKEILLGMESVLVAYSGGVDSTFLARVAHDLLGDRAAAVIAASELYPRRETESAKAIAAEMGIRLICTYPDEFQNNMFAQNLPDRCYYCKKELFSEFLTIAEAEGFAHLVHGANADDTGDFRPGQRAATELGVRAPLQEVGLAKAEIRELSKELGLPTWNKPSYACLATRFPYDTTITREAVERIKKAEELLFDIGFTQLRVRHHGTVARIEVEEREIERLFAVRDQVVTALKELGYLYITADLSGYKSGSMNAILQDKR